MRGRTNAEPNIGVQLNASVDNYVVATGENILAGDFVEQFNYLAGEATTDGNLINSFQPDEQHIFKMSDGNYLYFGAYTSSGGTYNRNVEIYEKDEYGVLTLVAQPTSVSFVSTGKPYISLLGDDTLAYIYVNNEMYVYVRLIHYDSTNHSITQKTINARIATISNTATSWQYSIVKKRGGGYKVFASYYYTGSPKSSNVYMADMAITGNNYDSYAVSISNTKTIVTSTSNSYHLSYAIELDTNYYLAVYAYTSSSNTWNKYYVIDEVNNVENTHSASANSPFISGTLLNRNGNNKIMTTVFVDTTNHKVYFKKLYMDTTEYTIYPDEELFSFTDNTTQVLYLGSDGTNDIYIIQKSTTELVPFVINKSTNVLTMYLGCIVDFTMRLDGAVASCLDSGNFLFASAQKIISMNYSNGTLESEVETVKRVRGITTQKYIKGVAKQSGTAGDTIQVYVPTVNS